VTDVLGPLVEELALRVADRAEEILRERYTSAAVESESDYLSVTEAAELLRAKPQRVYDLLSDGRLTRHKDGARVLIARAEIETYLNGGSHVAHSLPNVSRTRVRSGIAR
jgi:excisionase family DNA binding protein